MKMNINKKDKEVNDDSQFFNKIKNKKHKSLEQTVEAKFNENFANISNYTYLDDINDEELDRIKEMAQLQEVKFQSGMSIKNIYKEQLKEGNLSESEKFFTKIKAIWFDFIRFRPQKAFYVFLLITTLGTLFTFLTAIPIYAVVIGFYYMTVCQQNTKRYNAEIDNRKYVKTIKTGHSILFPLITFNTIFLMRMLSPFLQENTPLFLGILFGGTIMTSYYFYRKQVGGKYAKALEEKYYYDVLDENWTPEISVMERDYTVLKNAHPKIGVRVDTGEPVYLRYDDLFTHTLNMGGTGSGKTALAMFPLYAHMITVEQCGTIVIDPKGDFATEAYCLALAKKAAGELPEGREVHLFDPIDPMCPYFNPLAGSEADAVEMLTDIVSKLDGGGGKGNPYFENKERNVIEQSVRIVKYKDPLGATISDVFYLLTNNNLANETLNFCKQKLNSERDRLDEDRTRLLESDIAYFEEDYWAAGQRGERSQTYEHCNGTRDKVKKFVSSKYLNNIFNATGEKTKDRTELDFDSFVANKKILCISTGQGTLRDDEGIALAFAIIIKLQSYYLGVRKDKRVDSMLFIDEYQVFANRKMENLFTQGRGYRVAMHVATQSLGNLDKSDMRDVVTSNTFIKIFFPSLTPEDAMFFAKDLAYKEGYVESRKYKEDRVTGMESEDVGLSIDKKEVATIRTGQLKYEQAKHCTISMRNGIQQLYPILVQCDFIDGHIKPIVAKERREFEKKHNENIDNLVKNKSAEALGNNAITDTINFMNTLMTHSLLSSDIKNELDNKIKLKQYENEKASADSFE